jgi:hypothetical protein
MRICSLFTATVLLCHASSEALTRSHNYKSARHSEVSFDDCVRKGQSNYNMPGWDVLTRRLEADLDANSVVVEVGGSIGEDAAEYVNRYDVHLFVFELLPSSVAILRRKFANNPKVVIMPYGIGSANSTVSVCVSEGSTSAFIDACKYKHNATIVDSVTAMNDVMRRLKVDRSHSRYIDLLTINCEGPLPVLSTHPRHGLLKRAADRLRVHFS